MSSRRCTPSWSRAGSRSWPSRAISSALRSRGLRRRSEPSPTTTGPRAPPLLSDSYAPAALTAPTMSGRSFPMFAKVDVNGFNAHPVWAHLKDKQGEMLGSDVKWNFVSARHLTICLGVAHGTWSVVAHRGRRSRGCCLPPLPCVGQVPGRPRGQGREAVRPAGGPRFDRGRHPAAAAARRRRHAHQGRGDGGGRRGWRGDELERHRAPLRAAPAWPSTPKPPATRAL